MHRFLLCVGLLPLVSVSVGLFLAVETSAQTCFSGQTLLKNDTLPDNPAGLFAAGIVPGLRVSTKRPCRFLMLVARST